MMADASSEVETEFLKCCNLFKSGRIKECTQYLERLTFKKSWLLELGKENNVIMCRYVNEKSGASFTDTPRQSIIRAFEMLHEKVQGMPLALDNSDIQLLVAYNTCCMHLLSFDVGIGMTPDVTLDVTSASRSRMTREPRMRRVRHLHSADMHAVFIKWLRLCHQKVDPADDENTTIERVISVLTDDKPATVPSKEEMCLLLCLRSLTLMLDGQKVKPREHLEALLSLKFDPERLHITATSTDGKRGIKLTEMLSSLLALNYLSSKRWDDCLRLLTDQSSPTTHVVYMQAYVLYQQRQMCQAVALVNEHSCDADSRFNPVTLNLLGCCLSSQNKPYSAIEMFKRAALGDSCYAAPLYNMALQYRRLGLHDAELEALNLLVDQQKNRELHNKKPPSLEIYGDKVTLSSLSPLGPTQEPDVTLAQAMYTLCKRCLELERYHDAASRYKTLLALLHRDHMTLVTEPCVAALNSPLVPGVSLATVYVETAYSLLQCGDFADTVTVCKHLTGRSQSGMSAMTCDVEHMAALMYEVYALVGMSDFDAALSTLDMLIDLISPTVTAALAGGDSPPPVKKSRSNCRPKDEQDMRHLLANAYSYKSVLLQRDDQVPASLTYSRLALQLNTGEPEMIYNHTLLLLKLRRTSEACRIWREYRGITDSCQPPLDRKTLASDKSTRLLRELDQSALDNLDDVCLQLSHDDIVMDVT